MPDTAEVGNNRDQMLRGERRAFLRSFTAAVAFGFPQQLLEDSSASLVRILFSFFFPFGLDPA